MFRFFQKVAVWLFYIVWAKAEIEHYYRMASLQGMFRKTQNIYVPYPPFFNEKRGKWAERVCAEHGVFVPIHADRDKWIERQCQILQ